MEQYIPKSALVAEIDRQKIGYNVDGKHSVEYDTTRKILNILDTLEVKEVGGWKTVDAINPPQADRNKIYCVLSKNKYLLARVTNHPHDELLQWRCTEFPFHCYDMCEGDKYMQIV